MVNDLTELNLRMGNGYDLAASVLGWLGASLLLLAYFLNSRNRIRNQWVYHMMNLFGAAGLAVSTGYVHAYPALVLNVVWMGIALSALRSLDRNTGQTTNSTGRC